MKPIKWLFNYVLAIAMVCKEGVSTCGIHVCLIWKIIPNHLVLTCKVHDLYQMVLIYNNFDKEQAYCLSPHPTSSCHNEYENGTIYQNLNVNETIFSVRGTIDSRVNGNWTCRHGTSKDKAKVEVTIPVPSVITAEGNMCWMKLFSYTLLGFMAALAVFSLLICIIPCSCGYFKGPSHQQQMEEYITSKIDRITCKPDCCRSVKRVTYHKVAFIAVLNVVILIPVAVGLSGNDKCYGILMFISLGILGMVFGFLSSLFIWSAKDDNNTKSVVSKYEFRTTTELEAEDITYSVQEYIIEEV